MAASGPISEIEASANANMGPGIAFIAGLAGLAGFGRAPAMTLRGLLYTPLCRPVSAAA
jgi:hypothetical protein